MPKTAHWLSAVQVGGDLYAMGGYSNDFRTAINRLSCSSRVCTWTTMTQELTVGRMLAVAIAIPKSFCVPVEQ